jgi:hypothetical protein
MHDKYVYLDGNKIFIHDELGFSQPGSDRIDGSLHESPENTEIQNTENTEKNEMGDFLGNSYLFNTEHSDTDIVTGVKVEEYNNYDVGIGVVEKVEEVINESANDVHGLHDESTTVFDTKIDNLKFNKNLKKRTANQRLWKINTVLFSKQSLSVSQISGSETPGCQIPGLISNTEQLINENNSDINGIDNDYEYDKHFKKNELKSFFSDPKIALTDWMQVYLIFKFFFIFMYLCIHIFMYTYTSTCTYGE